MQVATRRVAGRVLSANEPPGRDLRAYVDARRRPAGHVGVPGDQAGGMGDDHEPRPRRRVVRVIAHEDHHAGARGVDRGQARGGHVNALMKVTAAANSRLRCDARAAELLGYDPSYSCLLYTSPSPRDA